MVDTLVIKDVQASQNGETARFSAQVDGQELFFQTTDTQFSCTNAADPIVCAALLPAMLTLSLIHI